MSAQLYRIVAAARVLRFEDDLSGQLPLSQLSQHRHTAMDLGPAASGGGRVWDAAGSQRDASEGERARRTWHRGDRTEEKDGSAHGEELSYSGGGDGSSMGEFSWGSGTGEDNIDHADVPDSYSGGCQGDVECRLAVLEFPSVLCNGCRVPPGGSAFLWSASFSAPHGTELAWTRSLEYPLILRLTPESQCWWTDECWVALSVLTADGTEVSEHMSVMLIGPWEPMGETLAPHEGPFREYLGPYELETLESGIEFFC
jgi:hypothetical protein